MYLFVPDGTADGVMAEEICKQGTIDPEKVSNVQKTSNKQNQEGRAEKLC